MALIPIMPQVITTDTEGNLVSFYDDETGELTLSFYNGPEEGADTMNWRATKLVTITLPGAMVTNFGVEED